VRGGFISMRTAAEVYGVALNPKTLALDEVGTDRSRRELSSRRGPLPLVTPDKPSAATWLKEHMLPDDTFVLDPQ